MIGSFGTLAAVASVNFKLTPVPQAERTFLLEFDTLEKAVAARDGVLKSVLQPAAIDLLSPDAAARLGHRVWVLALQVGGNTEVIERYEREFGRLGEGAAMEGGPAETLWRLVQDFTPQFLAENPDGVVVRASGTLKEVGSVMASFGGAAIARAGTGVCYGYFGAPDEAVRWTEKAAANSWKYVIEFSPESQKERLELWPLPGSDFETMRRVKRMFDPDGLLNRGRLYRRI
jgi:glycolate oxidase FAD binding subunit